MVGSPEQGTGRMPYSCMLRRAALVRTDVSEERIATIIWATRMGEPQTLAVTSKRNAQRRDIV
jgi:hypothetical protein